MKVHDRADIVIDFEDIPEDVLRHIERKIEALLKLDVEYKKYFVYLESNY